MNENIKILLDKVSGDEALLAKFSACKSIDEAYELASSLVSGYTKEEFVEVMNALNATDDADISDEDLAEAAGGATSFVSRDPSGGPITKSVAKSITVVSKSVVKSAKEASKFSEEVSKSVAKTASKVSKALAV